MLPSPLQLWDLDLFRQHRLEVWVKRDDLIHPLAGGNKFRKLRYQLCPDVLDGRREVVTFGGPASNHLVAAAWYCQHLGVQLTGYIRGEIPDNPCSRYLHQIGVKLISVERSAFTAIQQEAIHDALVIPFGGTHPFALPGVAEVVNEIRDQLGDQPVHLCVPAGSGGTFSGLASALSHQDTLRIYPAIRGTDLSGWVRERLSDSGVTPTASVWVSQDAAGQGFARRDVQLWADLCALSKSSGIWWDPVYNGKMILRLLQEARDGHIPPGSRVIVLHTGGLPGALAYRERFNLSLMPNMPHVLMENERGQLEG